MREREKVRMSQEIVTTVQKLKVRKVKEKKVKDFRLVVNFEKEN